MADTEELYCTCNKPQGNRFMIECSMCFKWFHGTCVGVKKNEDYSRRDWFCFGCTQKRQLQEQAPCCKEQAPCCKLMKKVNDLINENTEQLKIIEENKSKIIELSRQKQESEDMLGKKDQELKLLHDQCCKLMKKMNDLINENTEQSKIIEENKSKIIELSRQKQESEDMLAKKDQELKLLHDQNDQQLKLIKEKEIEIRELTKLIQETNEMLAKKEQELRILHVQTKKDVEVSPHRNLSLQHQAASNQILKSTNNCFRTDELIHMPIKKKFNTTKSLSLKKKSLSQPCPTKDKYDLSDEIEFQRKKGKKQ